MVEEKVQDDGAVYKGQIRTSNGDRHGYGIQIWPDGRKFEGNWRNNVREGRGKLTYVEGDVYDGK